MKAAAAISSAWIFCPSASAMHSWGNKYVMIYIWRRLLATIHRPIPTATNLAPKVGKDRYVGIWGCAGHSSRKIQNAWSEYCRAIPFSRGKNRLTHAVRVADVATGKLWQKSPESAKYLTFPCTLLLLLVHCSSCSPTAPSSSSSSSSNQASFGASPMSESTMSSSSKQS